MHVMLDVSAAFDTIDTLYIDHKPLLSRLGKALLIGLKVRLKQSFD